MTGRIPIPRTRLIGRESERASARAFLVDDAVPLLTLTGPGGVGKTRLALAIAADVASQFADGVVWVDLAPLSDPEAVAIAVAIALGVRPGLDHPVTDAVAARLRSGQVLVLLDNCEHHLHAVGDLVSTLLATCPALQMLATSRAPLRVRGEQILPTPPLAVPRGGSPLHEVGATPAAALFSERAQAVDPHFALTAHNADAVAQICQRLDGLPLAIELAAARSNLLSPAALLALLDQRLQVLGTGPRDAPDRHQTLQEAIAWSYDLLTSQKQASFRRLAVFTGGWSLEAAAAVTGLLIPDVLARLDALVDQSLVVRRTDADAPAPRFTMLETIRAFALEQLVVNGEVDAARHDHAAYFIALTDDATPLEMAVQESTGVSWDQIIRMESANIRAAMVHLIETDNGPQALQLSLSTAWFAAATSQEGRMWLEWSLAHTPAIPTVARGVALAELAYVRWAQGAYDEAQELAEASHAIAEHLNNAKVAANAFDVLGAIAGSQQHQALAQAHLTKALQHWREIGEPLRAADALQMLARTDAALGDHEAAARRAAEALKLYRQLRDPRGIATGLGGIGQIARNQGNDAEAAEAHREALALCMEAGERFILVGAFAGLAELASRHGQAEIAGVLLGVIDRLAREAGAIRQPTAGVNYERAHELASITLGAQRFTELQARGIQMPLDDAVTLAGSIRVPSTAPGNQDDAAGSWSPRVLAGRMEEFPAAIDLTSREQDILGLLAQRLTNAEIAEQLFIGRRTVDTHVGNLLDKLAAPNRRQAVAIAARLGLI